MPDFRVIPSIEQLRQREAVRRLERDYGRAASVTALRDAAAALRAALSAADGAGPVPADQEAAAAFIEGEAAKRLEAEVQPSLQRVINASGVVLHTNLGRAPLSATALALLQSLAQGYTNLEYDIELGARGSRDIHAERLLCRLLDAEAAVVVNNNAAATMLVLAGLASGREVVVSRGELVEIGGGFRIPDVMAQSGAILREVGTTNKTRIADYRSAISERTGLLLRVHRSNFRIEGFTEQPSLEELVALGRETGIPVAEDLGSGLIGLPGEVGARLSGILAREPTVQASLAAGVDLACFSGDKLLGGPQAGIIVGKREALAKVRRHPLMRAVRVGRLTYAALEGTLIDYVAGRAASAVPVVSMVLASEADLERRAQQFIAAVGASAALSLEVVRGASAIGGGSTPGLELPGPLLRVTVRGQSAAQLERRLRDGEPPVVARIERDNLLLDLRTVQDDEMTTLARRLHDVSSDSN